MLRSSTVVDSTDGLTGEVVVDAADFAVAVVARAPADCLRPAFFLLAGVVVALVFAGFFFRVDIFLFTAEFFLAAAFFFVVFPRAVAVFLPTLLRAVGRVTFFLRVAFFAMLHQFLTIRLFVMVLPAT